MSDDEEDRLLIDDHDISGDYEWFLTSNLCETAIDSILQSVNLIKLFPHSGGPLSVSAGVTDGFPALAQEKDKQNESAFQTVMWIHDTLVTIEPASPPTLNL